jgi:CRP-like cAMP-binding protein
MMTSGLMPQGSSLPMFRVLNEPRGPRTDRAVVVRRSLAADRTCLQRVAALLSAISRNNCHEGRDSVLIPDCLTSGFVADLLGLRVSDLADALVELENRGLVAQAQGSALRLTNLPELERLIESR